ncbi:hypothetical protein RhiJN_08531 [Ceratobasidium sp. AG-Ba]|nr:hypothetical protein RhiJN_08531 [Ceratobasidium sp. AG-Ba]
MASVIASNHPENLSSLPVGDCKLLYLSEIPWPPFQDYKPDLSGKYATAKQGPYKPIEVAPLDPDSQSLQTWRFKKTEEQNQYYIRPALDGSELGFHNEMDSSPGIPLTLSHPSVFIVPVMHETTEGDFIAIIQPRDTYAIIPAAATDYVTVSKYDDTVEVKQLDLSVPDRPVPAWLVTTRK